MKPKLFLALPFLWSLTSAGFAGVEQTVDDLLPKLASPTVEDRYAPQMELQALALKAARPGAEAERAELAKVLAARAADSAVPQPARVWLVRQLEYVGAAESVAALTTLLKDQDGELRECARRALEKDAAAAATQTLQAALKEGGEAAWRIGLLQSLGERGDGSSVSLIAQSLVSKETAAAAASALAKIASDPAIKELWTACDQKIAPAADALLAAADRLAAKGDAKPATAIYGRLYTNSVSPQLRAAALNGLAKVDPAGAKPLIAAALSSDQIRLQSAAVEAARVVYGKAVSATLAGLLPKLNATAKTFVLRALDSSAETQVIAATTDPDSAVRLAAFQALGQIGGAASVPVLVKTAADSSSGARKTAAVALARLSGPGADAAIARQAARGDSATRVVAIYALAERNDRTAVPSLLRYASELDPAAARAACAALGRLATDNELEALARLAFNPQVPGAGAALQAVAARAKDKPTATKKLVAMLSQAKEPRQQALLFDTLAILGGSEGLTAVSEAVSRSEDESEDAAVRALANWPDFAATKPLLAIAADPNAKPLHKVLAIQGVVRLVKASDNEPVATRLDAALAALRAAERDQEKRAVLSALAAVPDARAAEAIKPFLREAQFQAEAGLAGATLAEALLKTDREAAKTLAQALKDANLSPQITRRADAVLNKQQ